MQNVLQSWDPDRLAVLLRQAGEIALQYYDAPPQSLKSDRTVVTAADRAVEALFANSCDAPDSGVYLIGEETVDSHDENYLQTALAADHCYVIDPIDGTAPYTAHLPVWGISVGLMNQGRLVEGAVYLPALDECLATIEGTVMHCKLLKEGRWRPLAAEKCILGDAGHIGIGQLQAHCWSFDGPNQLFAWSSCVGSFYWLLTGRLLAYCGDFKLWDVAGMLPILERAGFALVLADAKRRELSGNLADGMFELAPGARRWRVKAPIVAAGDRETALRVLQQFHANL